MPFGVPVDMSKAASTASSLLGEFDRARSDQLSLVDQVRSTEASRDRVGSPSWVDRVGPTTGQAFKST